MEDEPGAWWNNISTLCELSWASNLNKAKIIIFFFCLYTIIVYSVYISSASLDGRKDKFFSGVGRYMIMATFGCGAFDVVGSFGGFLLYISGDFPEKFRKSSEISEKFRKSSKKVPKKFRKSSEVARRAKRL